MHQQILLNLLLCTVPLFVYSKTFPAWEPESKDVLCAKFLYFYEPKCFRGYIECMKSQLGEHHGIKRLQVSCFNLAQALAGCLKFFNDKCSQDLLQTGQASFTSTSLAPATRAALLNFRDAWISEGGANFGLDVNMCTVYGGLCEHPEQLEYCGGQTSLTSSPVVIFLLMLILRRAINAF